MTAATGTPGRREIQEAVRHALRPGPPPPYPELVALERTLLLVIAKLYGVVERQHRGEAADGRGRARMNSIRYQTSVGLGDGLMSAHMQVRALARDCQWLAEQHSAGTVDISGGGQ